MSESKHPDPLVPLQQLEQNWEVRERPFTTTRPPVIGPLIAGLRSAWNRVSTKWYVLTMVEQQNEFNLRTMQHLQQQWHMMENQHAWLIAQSREQSQLVHDLGEIGVQLQQMQKQLEALNTRLDQLKK